MQNRIINASVSHAKNKNGKVILVLNAARFRTSVGKFTASSVIHKNWLLFPKNIIEKAATGNARPICAKKVMPSHKKRLLSCVSHQLRKRWKIVLCVFSL